MNCVTFPPATWDRVSNRSDKSGGDNGNQAACGVLRRHVERLPTRAPATPTSRGSPGRSSRWMRTASRRSCTTSRGSAPTGQSQPDRERRVGLGLSRNMRDAYSFICHNYCEGDEIFLFGFSRGAYTARCIGGLIGFAGLIGKRDLDRFLELWKAYKEKGIARRLLDTFETRKNIRRSSASASGIRSARSEFRRIGKVRYPLQEYITASSTAISARAWSMRFMRSRSMSGARTSCRRCGRRRTPARRTVKNSSRSGSRASIRDVGGGYAEHGTSDIPLAWMASEVSPFLALDFDYLKLRRDLTEQMGAAATCMSPSDGFLDASCPTASAPELLSRRIRRASFEKVHASVATAIDGERPRRGRHSPYASNSSRTPISTVQ